LGCESWFLARIGVDASLEWEDEVEHGVYEGAFRKKIACIFDSRTKFYL
jgi:hypothetical protein